MRTTSLLAASLLVAFLGGSVFAQDDPVAEQASGQQPPLQLTDLLLGAPAAEQPTRYREFACGTNGGPPSTLLGGFTDFASCPIEAQTGLHEVTFRYDDELEYFALALDLTPIADRYGGTRYGTFPVIVSALFDDEGVLRAWRAVTDDRGTQRERRVAYSMSVFAKAQFAAGEWVCEELPLAEGETPVGRNFVKEDCLVTMPDGGTVSLRTRLLHRPGQSAIDPNSGEIRAGLYESTARLEVFDAGYEGPQT